MAAPEGKSPGDAKASREDTTAVHERGMYVQGQDLTPTGTAIDGEVEDYQVQLLGKPAKSLTATSEPDTTGSNLAIGEVASFSITYSFPVGVTESASLLDLIPDGLTYPAPPGSAATTPL